MDDDDDGPIHGQRVHSNVADHADAIPYRSRVIWRSAKLLVECFVGGIQYHTEQDTLREGGKNNERK